MHFRRRITVIRAKRSCLWSCEQADGVGTGCGLRQFQKRFIVNEEVQVRIHSAYYGSLIVILAADPKMVPVSTVDVLRLGLPASPLAHFTKEPLQSCFLAHMTSTRNGVHSAGHYWH